MIAAHQRRSDKARRGKRGVIERCFAPLKDWAEVATDVRGHTLDGEHYLAEELPDETFAELKAFFL